MGISEDLEFMENSLTMKKQLFGDEHPEVASSLNNLGEYLQSIGRLDEALVNMKSSLAMRKKLLGDDHPDVRIP